MAQAIPDLVVAVTEKRHHIPNLYRSQKSAFSFRYRPSSFAPETRKTRRERMSSLYMDLPRTDSSDACSDEHLDPSHPDAYISKTCTEEELQALFATYGAVSAVVIKRDRYTGNSLGYAFVQFDNRACAAAAKKTLHKHEFGTPARPLRLGWAQKNTTLFVGDLDTATVSTDQLRALFRSYGPLYEEETFVKHRNYGFVKFRFREDAERAKKELDGRVVGSRPIRIGWGDANTVKHTVHVQFDTPVPEAAISQAFAQFGGVTQVAMPRTRDGQSKGFALVHYEDTDAGENSAAVAIRALDGTRIGGAQIQASPGRRQNKHTGGRTRGMKSAISVPSSVMSATPGSPTAVSHMPATQAGAGGAGTTSNMVPVYVMAPVGPRGQWQPVTYMVPHMAHPHYGYVQQYYKAAAEKDG